MRRVTLQHTACVAVKKDQDAVEDEEKLDEAAMRAAEIHEVLAGLQDFKSRIIDGSFEWLSMLDVVSALCD